MKKEILKFMFEIYTDLITEKSKYQKDEDYPAYEIDDVISKLKAKIEEELK